MNVGQSDVLMSRLCVCVFVSACVCVCEFVVSLIIRSRGSNHTLKTIGGCGEREPSYIVGGNAN